MIKSVRENANGTHNRAQYPKTDGVKDASVSAAEA